jgi:hypothetical protein
MMLIDLTIGRCRRLPALMMAARVMAVMRDLEQQRTTLCVNSSAAETCTTGC